MKNRMPGPDPGEITRWIKETYPETVVAEAMGATFFSLDERHWPNFATIVTTDEHDMEGVEPVAAGRLSPEHRCGQGDVRAARRRDDRS